MNLAASVRALLGESPSRAWPERAQKKTPGMTGGPMLQEQKEKAWFFLTGGYQPKINKLIFLVIFLVQSASTMIA